eukprot:gene25233-10879_t
MQQMLPLSSVESEGSTPNNHELQQDSLLSQAIDQLHYCNHQLMANLQAGEQARAGKQGKSGLEVPAVVPSVLPSPSPQVGGSRFTSVSQLDDIRNYWESMDSTARASSEHSRAGAAGKTGGSKQGGGSTGEGTASIDDAERERIIQQYSYLCDTSSSEDASEAGTESQRARSVGPANRFSIGSSFEHPGYADERAHIVAEFSIGSSFEHPVDADERARIVAEFSHLCGASSSSDSNSEEGPLFELNPKHSNVFSSSNHSNHSDDSKGCSVRGKRRASRRGGVGGGVSKSPPTRFARLRTVGKVVLLPLRGVVYVLLQAPWWAMRKAGGGVGAPMAGALLGFGPTTCRPRPSARSGRAGSLNLSTTGSLNLSTCSDHNWKVDFAAVAEVAAGFPLPEVSKAPSLCSEDIELEGVLAPPSAFVSSEESILRKQLVSSDGSHGKQSVSSNGSSQRNQIGTRGDLEAGGYEQQVAEHEARDEGERMTLGRAGQEQGNIPGGMMRKREGGDLQAEKDEVPAQVLESSMAELVIQGPLSSSGGETPGCGGGERGLSMASMAAGGLTLAPPSSAWAEVGVSTAPTVSAWEEGGLSMALGGGSKACVGGVLQKLLEKDSPHASLDLWGRSAAEKEDVEGEGHLEIGEDGEMVFWEE